MMFDGLLCVTVIVCKVLLVIWNESGLVAVVIMMCILLYDSYQGITWILIKITCVF